MARLLIDSHVLLWHALDDARLGPAPTAAIEEGNAEVFVGTASLWEIAIKASIGKIEAPDDLPERVAEMGFELLPVSSDHAWHVRSLPLHHRDPLDRLLIAQAQIERLPIVTGDSVFEAYDVAIVWA